MALTRDGDRSASDATQEVIDEAGVLRLQRAYADAVTRRDWTAVQELFAPGAVVSLDLVARPPRRIDGPEAMVGFIGTAIARFAYFQFVILNSHVELWPDGDRDAATARVFMCELRQEHGADQRDDAFGLYRDRYARADGRWRFAERRYRSMARFPAGEIFPLDAD